MIDKTGVKMNDSRDKFLQRMFWYRLQYPVAFVVALLLSCGQLFFTWQGKYPQIKWGLPAAFVLFVALFNTVTYLYSRFLVKKFGIEMFADLDQEFLREHQGYDSKAFGYYFSRLIQCRKVAGVYMLLAILCLWPIQIDKLDASYFFGMFGFLGYYFYRMTYLDDAISYKAPNVFTGWKHRRFQDHLRGKLCGN